MNELHLLDLTPKVLFTPSDNAWWAITVTNILFQFMSWTGCVACTEVMSEARKWQANMSVFERSTINCLIW